MTRFERAGWLLATGVAVVVCAVVASVLLRPLALALAGAWPW